MISWFQQTRLRTMLATVSLGASLVLVLGLVYRLTCPGRLVENTLCGAIAKNPPWTLLTRIGSAPALVLLWLWRTKHKDKDIEQKQHEIDIAKREERSKRFVEAVRLLAEDTLAARLGAIYSLESLATDAPYERKRILETLCAFIRGHGLGSTQIDDVHFPSSPQPEDVQVAFTVVGRIPDARELDLRRAEVPQIEGIQARLIAADLSGADLSDSMFYSADFTDANLSGTNLSGAKLQYANLTGAKAFAANFHGTDLSGANLTNIGIDSKGLSGAEYSRHTIFPVGFTPENEGLVFTDDAVDRALYPEAFQNN
jgi:hypothetical protein